MKEIKAVNKIHPDMYKWFYGVCMKVDVTCKKSKLLQRGVHR